LTAKLPQSSSSWACYLVFKDRAASLLFGFVLPSPISQPVSPSTTGALLLFEPSGLVNFALRLPSPFVQNPPSGFVLPVLGRGAASTSLPRPASTGFGDPFSRPPCPGDLFNLSDPSAHFRTVPMNCPDRGGAASTSLPRCVSTGFVDPLFRPARTAPAPLCRERRAEGAGSVPPRHPSVKSFLIRRGAQDHHTAHGVHGRQPHNL
jgi:hypothetical protein